MAGFVKLHSSMLRSTIWFARPDREIFITALLMAEPREIREPVPQLEARTLNPTGWMVPPGWYGFCETSGPGLIRTAGIDDEPGMAALERLGSPEPESRSQAFDGRRLVRVDGGWIALNYDRYREKDTTAAERAARYRSRKSRRDNTAVTRDVTYQGRSVTQAEAEAEAERDLAKADEAAAKDLTASARPAPPAAPAAARVETRESEPEPTAGAARLALLQQHAPLDDAPGVPAKIPTVERNVVPAPRLPTRRERASADLMTCPLSELNARCKANPYDANNTPIHTRPEIVAVNDAWLEAVGLANRKLGLYAESNKPLLRILEALEVHSVERIMVAVKQAARDDWCRGKKGNDPHKCDVGRMTINVISRLLEAADDSRGNCSPAVAAMLEQAKRRETA